MQIGSLRRRLFSNLVRRLPYGKRRLDDMLLRSKDRSLYNALSSMRYPPDRGLDHAVGRERHLKPVINLKNFIVSEPSKSAPLSVIVELKEKLGIPFRPVEFIRKYPSIFQEFHVGASNLHPHIKLTPEVLSLNSEETLLYQSVNYKQEIASRLLKLLMISKIRKIPIFVLDRLSWELGLPHDFIKSIVPEFPDYFRVISGKHLRESEKILELVFWSDELAISEIEKNKSMSGSMNFALQFSNGFEMDKKYKKWLEDWQKLPYISPYQNASKNDECDNWVVSVLHEVLNLFVGKKADREALLCLARFWGFRSSFKRTLLQHPGIFYISRKIVMHTVVLRDGYRRGMLIERHPLMDVRMKYAKLMNAVKENKNPEHKQKGTSADAENSEGKESDKDDDGVTEDEDDQAYESSDENHLKATRVTNGRRQRRQDAVKKDNSAERHYVRRATKLKTLKVEDRFA